MQAIRSVLAALVLIAFAQPAFAADRAIGDFFGEYVGRSTSVPDDEMSPRDVSVTVRPKGRGFVVAWTSILHKAPARAVRRSLEVEFRPSGRRGIYASAMRTDKFGSPVPLDPLAGEPYVWARVRGATLSIYSVFVTDDGGYEMQVYDRTLVEGGMELTFTRIADGRPAETITAKLTRVGS